MPCCVRPTPRSTPHRRGCTGSSRITSCGRGTSPPSDRTCARTRRGGSLVSSEFLRLPGAVEASGVDAGIAAHYGNPFVEQRTLAAGEAVVDLSNRAVLSVAGVDRLSWIDSITSQAVQGLQPGEA